MQLDPSKRLHILGIGGIGISAVVRILHARGYNLSGSDVRQSALTDEMSSLGIEVFIGHNPENIKHADAVMVSTAIPEHNVELVEAKRLGLPIYHRSEVLNALSQNLTTIGVTGTHGKGTVSSMITWILECAGRQPGFVIGGRLLNFGINARDAGGEFMVLEVDESDGTHRNFDLDYVVCNFLELDHLNYYDDLNDISQAMQSFIENNDRLKDVFLNLDCQGNRTLSASLRLRPTGYGMEHQTEYRAEIQGNGQLPIVFEAFESGASLGTFELNLPGRYNVVNAMGAMAVARRVGIEVEHIREALKTYRGLENRFTIEQGGGVTIVKDYNSHPTCMRKVLESARDLTEGRIFSVFKPYRYTLIKYLQDEYGTAFQGSDEVLITTMYAANEDPIPGVDTQLVVDKIAANDLNVKFIPDQNDITPYLAQVVAPGDKVIFFGGDDFFQMADAFTADLARRAGGTAATPSLKDVGGPLDVEEYTE